MSLTLTTAADLRNQINDVAGEYFADGTGPMEAIYNLYDNRRRSLGLSYPFEWDTLNDAVTMDEISAAVNAAK